VKDLNNLLKIHSVQFLKVFNEIEEITKTSFEELIHSREYIRDLESHIKEIQVIEKQEISTQFEKVIIKEMNLNQFFLRIIQNIQLNIKNYQIIL